MLVARGTFGQPWIAEDIRRAQEGLSEIERDFQVCKEALIQHYLITKAYAHEKKAILDMRRVGCWYFKKGEVGKVLRKKMSQVNSLDEIEAILESLESPELFLKVS